jgi:hypothetical protein
MAAQQTNFKTDRLEAINPDNPSYLYIDKSDNEITAAIETIRNLVTEAKESLGGSPTTLEVVSQMTTLYNSVTSVNSLNQTVKNHLMDFSPSKSLFIDDTGFYTNVMVDGFTNLLTVSKVLIEPKTTNVPALSATIAGNPGIQVIDGKITIPDSIKTVAVGAFTSLQPNTVIITKKATIFDKNNLNNECVVYVNINRNQTMVLPIYYVLNIGGTDKYFPCAQDKVISISKNAKFNIPFASLDYVVTTSTKLEFKHSFDATLGIHVYETLLYDGDGSIIARGLVKYIEI